MVRDFKSIQDYRRDYYRNNKDYLLSYQKWYYSNRRYELGLIKKKDIYPKPNRRETYSVQKKKEKMFLKKTYGNFTIHFE